MRKIILAFLVYLSVSCSPIQQHSSISQATNTQLVAGIGDTIIEISKEKNLPNAFGASDIFGRKTPTGNTTLQYLGVRNNQAVFRRHSIIISSNANTMNSTPYIIQNTQKTVHSGMIGDIPYRGSSTTYSNPVVVQPAPPQEHVINQGTLDVFVNLNNKHKQLIIEGKTINIIHADRTELVYTISE